MFSYCTLLDFDMVETRPFLLLTAYYSGVLVTAGESQRTTDKK